MQLVPLITNGLSLLTIVGNILLGFLALSLFVPIVKPIQQIVRAHALRFAFIVATVATVGSLFYSEIAGYEPCKLCWLQRIAMYPQVLLLGTLLDKKEKATLSYGINLSIVLSGIGGVIALYHYLLQRGIIPHFVECGTVGYSVSCTDTFVLNYGYITIPFMSFTAFTMILFFLFLRNSSPK